MDELTGSLEVFDFLLQDVFKRKMGGEEYKLGFPIGGRKCMNAGKECSSYYEIQRRADKFKSFESRV